MAATGKKDPKRFNRAVGVAEAVSRTIDPLFRKRGFASRDIIANWGAIAPKPYDRIAIPDRLHWSRAEAGAEGAVLYLRCAEGHALALAHESGQIAAAINRYFGYVLVGSVKLSPMPFSPGSGEKADIRPEPEPETRRKVDGAVAGVADEGLKEALTRLGLGVIGRKG